MKSLQSHRKLIACILSLSLVLPSIGSSAEPTVPERVPNSLQAKDVSLDEAGTLSGHLVDRQGAPLANTPVTLWNRGEMVSRRVTATTGEFRFPRIRGGLYQITASDTGGIYRVWTQTSAPPSCVSGILLIQGDAVRAQQMGFGGGHYGGSVLKTLNNPWLMGGLVAAGIAIPIAISNDDDDRRGS